jgi:SAM-dependent methyltransferase
MTGTASAASHASRVEPSPWVVRFAGLIAPHGTVLDVACGSGRHARLLASLGHRVEAVDRDAQALAMLDGVAGVHATCADIEAGPWPYPGARFDAVVVINYLHRPLLPTLLASLAHAGVLIYETFASGNERYGRPANPQFLLQRGELLRWCAPLRVVGYEDLRVEVPRPALVQRLCAINAPCVPGW